MLQVMKNGIPFNVVYLGDVVVTGATIVEYKIK